MLVARDGDKGRCEKKSEMEMSYNVITGGDNTHLQICQN